MAGIIRSYGLFWSADNIFWGKGTQPGALLGVPARAKTSHPIDFRYQVGIYILYEGHHMIYVGQAGSKKQRLFGRLKRHRKDMLASRWDHFSWFGLQYVMQNGILSTKKEKSGGSVSSILNQIEAVLIAGAEPNLNKQGGRFGRETKRYLQVRDERLGLTHEQMIEELWKQQIMLT